MAKRQEQEEAVDTNGWLTTYGDMVTLLLTFFVLMYAISAQDTGKFQLFFAAFQPGGLTEEKFQAIRVANGMIEDSATTDPDEPPPDSQDPWNDPTVTAPEEEDDPTENEDLKELFEQLGNYVDQNDLTRTIELVEGEGDGDNLLIRLTGDVWFSPGSATVTPGMYEVAESLAQLLVDNYQEDKPFRIVVSGHTDNVPQNSPQYPTNWHLSHGRASNFLTILIEESEGIIPASQFFSQGYGEQQPIGMPVGGNIEDYNQTDEQRQQNRRVELLISQQKTTQKPPEETEESEGSDVAGDAEDVETPEEPAGGEEAPEEPEITPANELID